MHFVVLFVFIFFYFFGRRLYLFIGFFFLFERIIFRTRIGRLLLFQFWIKFFFSRKMRHLGIYFSGSNCFPRLLLENKILKLYRKENWHKITIYESKAQSKAPSHWLFECLGGMRRYKIGKWRPAKRYKRK